VQQIVGRDAELERGETFLDRAEREPQVLVLEGEAGIGKTTVWAEILRRATERGFGVLVARPAAAEANLTLSGLADLLEPLADGEYADLPEPQRRALDAALLRSDAGSVAPEGRVLGSAIRTVLARLATERPVLLALDDVQWVDPASATTIGFALRRLGDARLSVLASRRTGIAMPLGLAAIIDRDRANRLEVRPLSVAALHHILKRHLRRPLSRPTLVRVHRAADGNPFFALEIVRLLEEVGEPAPDVPLPVPADVRELLRSRMAKLPAPTREALLAVATIAVARLDLVDRALERHAEGDLERAIEEDIVGRDGDVLGFRHPLFQAAVYGGATPAQRRTMHARLARILAGSEEGARHGALATDGPDPVVAAALDDAAREADGRAAPAAAAELHELAISLTPPNEHRARDRRRLALASAVLRAGDPARATAILEDVAATALASVDRSRARLELAPIRYDIDSSSAVALCEAVLADDVDDPEIVAEAHALLAVVGDPRASVRHLSTARDLLEALPDPDPKVLGLVLGHQLFADAQVTGDAIDGRALERVLELERRAPRPSVSDRISAALGAVLKYRDDLAGARLWLERTHRAALDEGDEASLPYVLNHFPQLDLWTGDWTLAEAHARGALEISMELGLEAQRRQALVNLATVYAHQGRVEAAREASRDLLAAAESDGDDWTIATCLPSLGLLELSLGRIGDALEVLERAAAMRVATGDDQPRRHESDLVEAFVAAGRLGEAESALGRYEPRAALHGLPSHIANLARSRGLLLAAQGDLDAAAATLDEALRRHEAVDIPFDRARTLLALGRVRRRRKERRAAKDALEAAASTFERLGAPLWLAMARDEIGRLGLRQGRADALTEGERRVAELAASGLTNREVAGALFLSPKTVEAHLARAYQKLNITSRAELGAVMAHGRTDTAPS
jgi:DNA-binding CsgD family transcriptional regulator